MGGGWKGADPGGGILAKNRASPATADGGQFWPSGGGFLAKKWPVAGEKLASAGQLLATFGEVEKLACTIGQR